MKSTPCSCETRVQAECTEECSGGNLNALSLFFNMILNALVVEESLG